MPTSGLLEIQRLLPRYQDHLTFFRRFIDDGFFVWLYHPAHPHAWRNFMQCLNTWGSLKWTCDGHTDSLVFLDLEISITKHNWLHYQTYQKPINQLYQPQATQPKLVKTLYLPLRPPLLIFHLK
jgi:hypothetical protein